MGARLYAEPGLARIQCAGVSLSLIYGLETIKIKCFWKVSRALVSFPVHSQERAVTYVYVAVKPGEKYREIGNVIQKHAQANGFSVVRSYCGHGIHQLFHTAPSIPHYSSQLISVARFHLSLSSN